MRTHPRRVAETRDEALLAIRPRRALIGCYTRRYPCTGTKIASRFEALLSTHRRCAVSLLAIAYVSSTSNRLSKDDLRTLRDEWFDLCSNAGVTGLVLHNDGSFIGYLEGETEALTRAFADIRLDRRHHLVTTVLNGPCARREFNTWSLSDRLPAEVRHRRSGAPRPGSDLLRAMWVKSR